MDDSEIYRQKRMANNPTRLKEAEAHYAQFTAEEEQEQKALLANHALVGSALILLSQGLRPFVEQALEQAYGKNWLQTAETEKWFNRNQLDKRSGKVNLDDVSILVSLITEDARWQKAFKTKLINEDKNRLYQLREVRNTWAHNKCEEFTARYTHALLDAVSRMLKVLGATTLAQKVDRMEPVLEQSPQSEINLYDRALALFNDYLDNLSSNALTAGDRLIFNRSDVYVPLGLVERQEPARRKPSDGLPDQGADLYQEPRETIREISQDDFYEKVLAQGQSKSRGKRLAIVGEPGSGKTTRLQDIAEWVFEQRDQQGEVAIWVSLGTIGTKSLRDYLLQDWLRDAAGALETAPPEWVSALEALLQSGNVWLLLDGADEMTVPDPLSKLYRDLKAPIFRSVRTVLTCRLNTWEANKNALYNFDVYRNLDFSPEQVSTFIQRCLPESSTALETELAKPGKERIRNLVKNPLRLMLLCSIWQANQRTEGYQLPDTKAGLYAQFVQKIYDWKAETICEQQGWSRADYCAQQSQLNDFLGELAKQAIDQTRFAIPQSLIQQILDDPALNLNPALFQLALDIGWLNHVGVAAENPLERVYAFYHPSFQEYFAALEIDDWDFFLPREHVDRPIPDKSYRIFESHWQEAILLWCGKHHDSTNLLSKLLKFDDNCDGFYSLASYFLGAKCLKEITELPDLESEKIISKIIDYAFGNFDEQQKKWCHYFPKFMIWEARRIISSGIRTDITQMLLLELLETYDKCDELSNECIGFYIASCLIDIGVSNERVDEIYSKGCFIKADSKKDPEFSARLEKVSELAKNVAKISDSSDVNCQEIQVSAQGEYELNEATIDRLIGELIFSQEWQVISEASKGLLLAKEICQCSKIINSLKSYLPEFYNDLRGVFKPGHFRSEYMYDLVWHCVQNISYPDFHKAWNDPKLTL